MLTVIISNLFIFIFAQEEREVSDSMEESKGKVSRKNSVDSETHRALQAYDLCHELGKREPRNGVSCSKRRVFLRSYPLPWEDGDNGSILEEEQSEEAIVIQRSLKRVSRVVHSLAQWRLTVLLFKKLKRKAIAYYMGSCHALKLKLDMRCSA